MIIIRDNFPLIIRLIFGSLALVAFIIVTAPSPIPRCQEDDIIRGLGEFHSSGYWDYYICDGDN